MWRIPSLVPLTIPSPPGLVIRLHTSVCIRTATALSILVVCIADMAQPRQQRRMSGNSMQAARPVSSFYGGVGGGPGGGSSSNNNRDSYISTGNRSSMFYGGSDYPAYDSNATRPYSFVAGGQRNSYYSQISQMQDTAYSEQPSPTAQMPDLYGDFNKYATVQVHK